MKLLASDFDNTLWFSDHMQKKDVKAIKRFQKHRHLFGLCSGRSLEGVLRPSQKYGLNYDFYILLSGGIIYNKNKEIIFEKKIPLSIVKDIYDFVDRPNITIVNDNQTYMMNTSKKAKMRGMLIESFDEIGSDEINAFSFHYSLDEIDKVKHITFDINEKYSDYVEAFQNNQHIDLVAKGCSKGNGIAFIKDYYHLEDDDIYGIGDSWNDIPMLKSVTHGYSFTYAPLEVQDFAEGIVHNLAECIGKIDKNNKIFVFFQKRKKNFL